MKKTSSLKVLSAVNCYFFGGRGKQQKMSLNPSEMLLFFIFSTKGEQNKMQKEERSAKIENANFSPPALIFTLKFLFQRQSRKDLFHY